MASAPSDIVLSVVGSIESRDGKGAFLRIHRESIRFFLEICENNTREQQHSVQR